MNGGGDMHERYINKLKTDFDFDYHQADSVFGKLGNAPGIYPDVAYLLFKLAYSDRLNSIFETGSGFSTLILAMAAARLEKEFVAVEALEKWFGITTGLLDAYSLTTDCVLFSDCIKDSPCANDSRKYVSSETRNVIELDFEPDFAWLDGMAMGPDVFEGRNLPYHEVRIMTCEYYADKLKNSLLVLDDVNTPFGDELPAWLETQGRQLDYIFNPTGRSDRHIGFSFPEDKRDLISIVKECE